MHVGIAPEKAKVPEHCITSNQTELLTRNQGVSNLKSIANLLSPTQVMTRLIASLLLMIVCQGVPSSRQVTKVTPIASMRVDQALTIGARAIIRGTVEGIRSQFDAERNMVFTYISLRVEQVLKGRLDKSEIVLKEEGGETDVAGCRVWGTPQFQPGERVIVWLDTWSDGSLRTYQLFLGKFAINRDQKTGSDIVSRDRADADYAMLAPGASEALISEGSRELTAFTREILESVGANASRSRDFEERYFSDVPLLAEPPEYRKSNPDGFEPRVVLLPIPARWFEPDNGDTVNYYVASAGIPNPQVVDDVAAAIDAWQRVPATSLKLFNGGLREICSGVNGVVPVVFNNCDGRFQPEPDCARIIARGGIIWDNRITKQTNGQVFRKALRGFMSLNPYSACSYENHCDLREVVTHELGHSLGLGHSVYPEATMYGTIHFDSRCAALRTDDARALAFVYPTVDPGPKPLAITTSTISDGVEGRHFVQVLEAEGGTLPYSWSFIPAPGRPPEGTTVDPSGALVGPLLKPGSSTFLLVVTDANGDTATRQFTATVFSRSSMFDSQFLSQSVPSVLRTGQQFTATIRWSNAGSASWDSSTAFAAISQYPSNNRTWGTDRVAPGPPIVQSGGQLELRMNLTAPSREGAYDFQWQLFQKDLGLFGDPSPAVTVFVYSSLPLTIDEPAPVRGFVGAGFDYQLKASGGEAPYSWTITDGTLPAGLSLAGSSGRLAGTPVSIGSTSVIVRVTDSQGRTADKQITINILDSQLQIATTSLPGAVLGVAYSAQLAAVGGKAPLQWAITRGVLATGLALNGSSGAVTGVPTSAGDFEFDVRVTDAESKSSSKSFVLSVAPASLRIDSTGPVQATRGSPLALQLTASGGVQPYDWSLEMGSLPAGLSLDATGLISGTPTASATSQTVVIGVRDAQSRLATSSLQIVVQDAQNAPVVSSVKYKSGKRKLIVRGERFDAQSQLELDGSIVPARFDLDMLTAKKLSLASGSHQVRVINSAGAASPAFGFAVP